MSQQHAWIKPDWNLPNGVHALCTTRLGGQSLAPYDGLNLALHVQDDAETVKANRQWLQTQANLPSSPFWLEQAHTTTAFCLDNESVDSWQTPIADAAWTTQPGKVAVVMTADCIPILFSDQQGTVIGAIHAGWRGLCDGIVTQALTKLPVEPETLTIWIGPCIRQAHFEVGAEVLTAFTNVNPDYAQFFDLKNTTSSDRPVKYLADLAGILKSELAHLGVTQVVDSGLCTFSDEKRFFSYRKTSITGRMASMIWMDSTPL